MTPDRKYQDNGQLNEHEGDLEIRLATISRVKPTIIDIVARATSRNIGGDPRDREVVRLRENLIKVGGNEYMEIRDLASLASRQMVDDRLPVIISNLGEDNKKIVIRGDSTEHTAVFIRGGVVSSLESIDQENNKSQWTPEKPFAAVHINLEKFQELHLRKGEENKQERITATRETLLAMANVAVQSIKRGNELMPMDQETVNEAIRDLLKV